MTAVADVLIGAADLIERDGWCQYRYRGDNGEHCVTDALMRCADMGSPGDSGYPMWASDLFQSAADHLRAHTDSALPSAWNDTPGRTKAEVVAALRAAAERAS